MNELWKEAFHRLRANPRLASEIVSKFSSESEEYRKVALLVSDECTIKAQIGVKVNLSSLRSIIAAAYLVGLMQNVD